jgi:RimJ/RimL family protein N-acetyltransferase
MRSPRLTDGVVLLRPPTDDDVDAITQACQDPEVAAWVSTPEPYERTHAEGFLAHVVQPGWESGRELVWSIRDATDDRLLGMIGLHGIAEGSAELGFWMASWGRGRGVATRAVALVLDHALDPGGLDLVRVLWQAFVGNWPSRRIAWRAGFRVEGTIRQHVVQRDGVRRDAWIGTFLRDDPREPNEPWPPDAPADGAVRHPLD